MLNQPSSTLKYILQCVIGTSLKTSHYTLELHFLKTWRLKTCNQNSNDGGPWSKIVRKPGFSKTKQISALLSIYMPSYAEGSYFPNGEGNREVAPLMN